METSRILRTSDKIYKDFDTLIDDIDNLALGLKVRLAEGKEPVIGAAMEEKAATEEEIAAKEEAAEKKTDEEKKSQPAIAADVTAEEKDLQRQEFRASHKYFIPGAITSGAGVVSLGTGGLFLYLSSQSLSEAKSIEESRGDYTAYVDSKTAAKNRMIASLVLGSVGLIGTGAGVFLILLKTPLP